MLTESNKTCCILNILFYYTIEYTIMMMKHNITQQSRKKI